MFSFLGDGNALWDDRGVLGPRRRSQAVSGVCRGKNYADAETNKYHYHRGHCHSGHNGDKCWLSSQRIQSMMVAPCVHTEKQDSGLELLSYRNCLQFIFCARWAGRLLDVSERRPSFKTVARGLPAWPEQRREGHETQRNAANSIKKLLKTCTWRMWPSPNQASLDLANQVFENWLQIS